MAYFIESRGGGRVGQQDRLAYSLPKMRTCKGVSSSLSLDMPQGFANMVESNPDLPLITKNAYLMWGSVVADQVTWAYEQAEASEVWRIENDQIAAGTHGNFNKTKTFASQWELISGLMI
jgi:hypothetical protein